MPVHNPHFCFKRDCPVEYMPGRRQSSKATPNVAAHGPNIRNACYRTPDWPRYQRLFHKTATAIQNHLVYESSPSSLAGVWHWVSVSPDSSLPASFHGILTNHERFS